MSFSDSRESLGRGHVQVQSSRAYKKLKDPAAPRVPSNCFLLYSNDHREAVKMELEAGQQGSVKAPVVSYELGKRWSMLSSEEKMKYENKFKEDKAKYEKAMAVYRPSEEFLMKVKQREENIAKKQFSGVGSGKVPQGMMKAYFDFVSDNWLRVAVANHGLSPVDLQRVLWREWTGQGDTLRKGRGSNVKKRVRKAPVSKDVNDSVALVKHKEQGVEVSCGFSDPISPAGDKSMNDSEKINESSPEKITSINSTPMKVKVDDNQKTKHNKHESEEWMETAFSLFEVQLSKELRKMMPDLGQEEMSKCVRAKWTEISEEQKNIFYKEMMEGKDNV